MNGAFVFPLAAKRWQQPDSPTRIHHIPAWLDGGEKWNEPPAEKSHEDEDAPYLASRDDAPPESDSSDFDPKEADTDAPVRVAEHPAEPRSS